MTFIFDLSHAFAYAAPAVQALTTDKGEQKACMDWIKEQLNARRTGSVWQDCVCVR